MRFAKAHTLCVVLFLSTFDGLTQRFSEDKAAFRAYAIRKLKSIGTESAFKTVSDFQNAWDGKFTSQHQDKILEIALEMQKKGYRFYPYFYHYFTYLAYSVAQENLRANQLEVVLKTNYESVKTLSKSEYKEFLFGLNIFFERRYLSRDKTFSVQALDGTYDFKFVGEQYNFREDAQEKGIVAVAEELEEKKLPIEEEPGWGNDQGWDNNQDSWGNTSDSGQESNDDWDNPDSWGNNNDGWGNDSGDSWGNSQNIKTRPAFQVSKARRPGYIPVTPDYLAQKQSQYLQPLLDGPVIEITGANLVIATLYDSLIVKNFNGSFLLKSRSLLADRGFIDWPARNEAFRGAVVQLADFYLKKDHAGFWTPNAKLQFGELTGGGQVEGIFEYRSGPRPKQKPGGYPIFTSNNADQEVRLNDERLSYTGGVQLRGDKLFGKAVSKEPGTSKILDKRGNYILLKSKEFDLGDSLISMSSGSITIVHGADSIHNESVRAKYDLTTEKFKALRNNTLMPFRSSYFDINFNIDLITWDMNTDSISLEIMNGKDLLPATFESEQFFNNIRYKKLGRALNFHPINAAVLYALKYDFKAFYVAEMAIEYDINENFAKAAGEVLSQYGFADYNRDTGYLKLHPRAFHYYYSSAQKFDYDNLMIPSKIKNGANACIRLDSGKMNVRGVSRFFLTTDFKIFAEPKDSTVTILRGRDLEFDGMVHAGNFQFRGVNYHFDYDGFLLNLAQIDSISLTVPLRDSTQAEEGFKTTQLQNQLTATSGTLFIDLQDNKSGVAENDHYPYFNSDSESTVYFNGLEILNGAYDKSVRFIIPAFDIDSMERENGRNITFEGAFNSGGIFPTFPETLRIQEDGSLGFTHKIPNQGYNLYGTEARTYEEISLSNKGMRGYGQIDFLTTTIYSNDFIYYLDSVMTDGTKGVISPGDYNGAYDMRWIPGKDRMYIHTVGDPFKFYNSTAELSDGFVNITTNGVYGGGTLLTRGSRAKSGELNFKEFEYSARHADFEVLTDDPFKPAMAGTDIRLYFELVNNTATVRSEKVGEAAISFPYAQMKTSISEAVWDLEDSVVTMIKPPDIPLENSYFYTTRKDLDSLAFNGERASYDINTQELTVEGIPFITVADSRIVPEGNKTTILANSVLRQFKNAEIIIDTLNGYHYLDRAHIRIISRNKFEGNAFYKQIIGKDTFDIRFDSFELQDVPVGEPDRKGRIQTRKMTVSGGEVLESQNLVISPGFLYKTCPGIGRNAKANVLRPGL